MAKDKKKKETSPSASSTSNLSDAPTRISISSSDSGFSKNSQDDQSFGEGEEYIPGASSSLLVASSAATKKKHRFSIRNLLGGKKESSKELSPGRGGASVTQSTSSLDEMKKAGLSGSNIGVSLDVPTLDTSSSSDQALLDLQKRIKESDFNGTSSMSPSSPNGSTSARSNNSPRVSSPIASSGGSPRTNLASNEKIIHIEEFERLKNCEQELADKLNEIKNFEEVLALANAKHKQESEEKEGQVQQLKKSIEDLTNQCEQLKQSTSTPVENQTSNSQVVDVSTIEQLKRENEEKLQQVKNEHATLMEQAKKDLSIELDQLKKQVETMQSTATQLTKEKEELETKIKELTSENEGLMDDLVNLDSRASDVKKTLEKKNKDLTTELDELKKKLQEQTSNEKKEAQKAILEQSEKLVSNTTGDHAEKVKAEFEKLKRWNQELNDMLSLEQQSMSTIEKERDQLVLQVEELKKKLEEPKETVKKTIETTEDGEEPVDMETLMKSLEEITLERDVLEELRQEELLEYEKEKEELAGEILSLKEELEKLTEGSQVPVIAVAATQPLVDTTELDNLKKLVQSLKMENEELTKAASQKSEKIVEQVEKVVEKEVEKIVERVVEKIVEKEVEKIVEVEKVVEKLVPVGDGEASVEINNLREQVDTLVTQLDQTQEQVRDYEKQIESDRLILAQLKKELSAETQKSKNAENELKRAKTELEKQVSSVSTASATINATEITQEVATTNSEQPATESSNIVPTEESIEESSSIRRASFEAPVISSLEKEDLYKIRSKYNYYDSDEEHHSVPQQQTTTPVPTKQEEPEEEEPSKDDEDEIYQDELKKFEKDLDKVLTKTSINLSKGKITSLKELELLCIKLKFNKTVKILDLSSNTSIDNRGLKIICDMLRWNTTVTDLYLEDTSITTLNPHLFDVFNENFKLTNVAFSEDYIPSAELDKLDTLLDRNETY